MLNALILAATMISGTPSSATQRPFDEQVQQGFKTIADKTAAAKAHLGPNRKARKCRPTGAQAMCGDASSLVQCEGFRSAYFIANDQAMLWATIELLARGSSQPIAIAKVQAPKATFSTFNGTVYEFGPQMLAGTFQPSELGRMAEYYGSAVAEVQAALEKAKRDGLAGKADSVVPGEFAIPMDAPLYKGCYKREGVVTPETEEKPRT